VERLDVFFSEPVEDDELLRALDRQHLKQHGIDHAEHRCVGADPERE
jgi:hypothetical protein